MKKLLSVFAIVLAIAASAFTAPTKVNQSNDPMLHWFTPDGQTYLGQRTVSAQESICDGNNQLCASGYFQITEDEEPVVETFETDVLKP